MYKQCKRRLIKHLLTHTYHEWRLAFQESVHLQNRVVAFLPSCTLDTCVRTYFSYTYVHMRYSHVCLRRMCRQHLATWRAHNNKTERTKNTAFVTILLTVFVHGVHDAIRVRLNMLLQTALGRFQVQVEIVPPVFLCRERRVCKPAKF
jgi:hypothetical protein